MIQVWRVQDTAGKGMYIGTKDGFSYVWQAAHRAESRFGRTFGQHHLHPLPEEDFGRAWLDLDAPNLYSFGFASLEQAREWLYDDFVNEELDRLGLNLVCYMVPENDAMIGDRQAAFRRDRAVYQGMTSVSSLNTLHIEMKKGN